MRVVFRDLAAKGAIYGLGSSLNGLVGFLLIPFYLHQLQAAEYGRYAIAETWVNLLGVVLGLGFNVSLLAVYPQKTPEERPRFFGEVLTFVLWSTVVIELLFLGAYAVAHSRWGAGVSPGMARLVAAVSAVEALWLLYATLYRAEGWAWRYVVASFLQLAVGLVATILLIALGGYREEGILLGRLIGDLAVCVAVLAMPGGRVPLRWRPSAVASTLRIGIPQIPATFANLWVLMSPRLFVDWFGSKADVGVFTISTKIGGVLSLILVQPFARAWMVSLFQVFERPDARRVYGRVVTYYVLVGAMLAAVTGLAAYAVVPLLARETFPVSAAIVLVMAMATVASGLMYPLNIGPYVTGRTTLQTPVFLASGVLVSVLGAVLTRAYGVMGGAAALLIVFLVQAVALVRLNQRLYPIEFETGRLIKIAAALAVGLCAAWLAHQAVEPRLGNWLLVPVFLVVASGLLWGLKFPMAGELAALRAIGSRARGGA